MKFGDATIAKSLEIAKEYLEESGLRYSGSDIGRTAANILNVMWSNLK